MTISVDAAACISCGMCAERLPAVFCIDRTLHTAEVIRKKASRTTYWKPRRTVQRALLSFVFQWILPDEGKEHDRAYTAPVRAYAGREKY